MLITTYSPEPHLNIRFVPEPIMKVKKIVKMYREETKKRKDKKSIFIDTYA